MEGKQSENLHLKWTIYVYVHVLDIYLKWWMAYVTGWLLSFICNLQQGHLWRGDGGMNSLGSWEQGAGVGQDLILLAFPVLSSPSFPSSYDSLFSWSLRSLWLIPLLSPFYSSFLLSFDGFSSSLSSPRITTWTHSSREICTWLGRMYNCPVPGGEPLWAWPTEVEQCTTWAALRWALGIQSSWTGLITQDSLFTLPHHK